MPIDSHPSRRAEDTHTLERLNRFVDRFRWLLLSIVSVAVWLGVQWKGPGDRIGAVEKLLEVHNDVIELRVAKQDTIIAELRTLVKFNVESTARLERLQCFNSSYTDRELELAGLDRCSELRRVRDRGGR